MRSAFRVRGFLLVVILFAAPFLRSPVFHSCPMAPEASAATCCCGGDEDRPSGCCTVIPLPLGERIAAVTTPLVPPDLHVLAGLVAPPAPTPAAWEATGRRFDPNWGRPPRPPLYRLHSILLS